MSVIDDYGHHPTEIKATLAAARQCGFRKVHVVFQPHRYTRTRDLIEEFTTAFGDADSLFVLDIYAASEKPIEGISGEGLARTIREKGGPEARYVSSFADAVSLVAAVAEEGDMILTLGAGSVSQLGPMILERVEGGSIRWELIPVTLRTLPLLTDCGAVRPICHKGIRSMKIHKRGAG